jgi:hypothetical protein
MQEGEIVVGLLFPADEQATKAIGPRMSTLHNPATSTVTRLGFQVVGFLATRFDVRYVMPLTKIVPSFFRIVSFIETKMLSLAPGWVGSANGFAVERSLQQSDIVRVGATYFHTQRYAASVSEHRPLGAQFATIGRVFAGFFPHPVAIWSSPRLHFANPTGCLLSRRIRASIASITLGRHLARSIPESSCVGHFQNQTPWGQLSTGIRFAKYRICRWQLGVEVSVVGLLWGWGDTLVARAPCIPKVHLANTMRNGSAFVTSWAPPCKEKNPEEIPSLRMPLTICSVLG